MHGAPPRDFPPHELREFFQLHAMAELGREEPPPPWKARLDELSRRVRAWPRTATNDPFHAATLELAEAIEAQSGCPAYVGFNEFCDPGIEAAVEAAIASGASRVVVLTPMLTRGGEHAEVDIPCALERIRQRHPRLALEYAWPFPVDSVARFLLRGAEAPVAKGD
jgi:sirohydrochlorin cobaltochelatase